MAAFAIENSTEKQPFQSKFAFYLDTRLRIDLFLKFLMSNVYLHTIPAGPRKQDIASLMSTSPTCASASTSNPSEAKPIILQFEDIRGQVFHGYCGQYYELISKDHHEESFFSSY